MTITPGTRLGPYEVQSAIGAAGALMLVWPLAWPSPYRFAKRRFLTRPA